MLSHHCINSSVMRHANSGGRRAGTLTLTSTDISYPLYNLVEGAVTKDRAFLAVLAQPLNATWRWNRREQCKRKRIRGEHTGHRLSVGPHTVGVDTPRPKGAVAVGVLVTIHIAEGVVHGGLAVGGMKTSCRRRRMGLRGGWWRLCYVGTRRSRALLFTMDALFDFAICLSVAFGVGFVKSCERIRVRASFGLGRAKDCGK